MLPRSYKNEDMAIHVGWRSTLSKWAYNIT